MRLKTEQHQPHQYLEINSGCLEGYADPVDLLMKKNQWGGGGDYVGCCMICGTNVPIPNHDIVLLKFGAVYGPIH